METRVQFPHLGPSLPQMGIGYSKVLDRVCWRVSMAGDYSGGCSTSIQPSGSSSAASFAAGPVNQLLVVSGSHKRPKFQRVNVFTFEDGHMRLIRHRMSRGQRDGAVTGKTKVRSFVDEATASSAHLELGIPSVISERSDGNACVPDLESREFREPDDETLAEQEASARVNDSAVDQEGYGQLDQRDEREYGSETRNMESKCSPSVDLEYNYEDMKLGEQKNWSIADMKKIDMLRNFEYRQGNKGWFLVVQAMRVEHMKATEELLVDSFAELMGGLLTYRPLLALTVRQYVRDRNACLPNAVTLVGMYSPAADTVEMGTAEKELSGDWLLAGTVELSFSNAAHPDIPAGPPLPPGSPYLCNMAVSSAYRRQGLGRQILKAAEELAVLMGAQDLYLHCRMGDMAPLNMYQSAGYQIVATDSILSLLSFQRRRHLMRKSLSAHIPNTIIS